MTSFIRRLVDRARPRFIGRLRLDSHRGIVMALTPEQTAALEPFAAMHRQMIKMIQGMTGDQLMGLFEASMACSSTDGGWEERGAARWILPTVRGTINRRAANG